MPSSSPSSSTNVGFWSVAPLLGRTVVAALARLLTFPFRTVRSTTLYSDVLYAAIRCALGRITIAQTRYLNSSTTEHYIAHCTKLNITPQTLEVNENGHKVAAHWIGSPDAEVVILYLHGGGFTQPASAGNYHYISRLVGDLNSAKGCRSVAGLFLAYTLAPEATHPTQLREAVTLLSHLVNKTGRSPSDIVLSGSSAGGNLAVAVLAHILHPHPDVPAMKLHQPLLGTVLYSPWVGFGTDYPSYDNETLDMMSPLALRKWSAMFLNKASPLDPEADPGPVSGDAWTEVCMNDSCWWHGLQGVVDGVFVSYGSYEVLADSIRIWEKQLKKGWVESGGDGSRLTFFEGLKEAHVAPILDSMAPGASSKSNTQMAVEEWYKFRLEK